MMNIPRNASPKSEQYFKRVTVHNSESPYKFGYARTALKFGLRELAFPPNSTILLPEFICDVILPVLRSLGISTDYYSVNASLEPDLELVPERNLRRAVGIIMVHYFGQPQEISQFKSVSEKYNLILIEDNAHGFGGHVNGRMLGSFGDIGICSPRKSLPILNGAYLYSKRKLGHLPSLPLEPSYLPLLFLQKKVRKFIAWRRLRRIIVASRRYARSSREENASQDWGMDAASENYINSIDISENCAKRKIVYHIWEKWAVSQSLTPVFKELALGACPLVFPAFTNSFEESKRWLDWGDTNGIDIHQWPDLPREVVLKNSGALKLWEKMICLPINTEIDVAELSHFLKGTCCQKVI